MRPVASPLFQGLSAEEWAALEQSGCLRTKSYPRHAVIFHAGEHVHALGVVLRGTVHIENLDLWGSKSILSSISAGQAFAETYALCGDVMMVDAVAAEECEVLFVNISAFSGGAPGSLQSTRSSSTPEAACGRSALCCVVPCTLKIWISGAPKAS